MKNKIKQQWEKDFEAFIDGWTEENGDEVFISEGYGFYDGLKDFICTLICRERIHTLKPGNDLTSESHEIQAEEAYAKGFYEGTLAGGAKYKKGFPK